MHHFLCAGVGFGMMPLHVVLADLTSGALVEIHVEDDPREGPAITMSAAYLTNKPPGRAGRWFIDRLKEEAAPRVNRGTAVSAGSISLVPSANRNPVLLQSTVESSLGPSRLGGPGEKDNSGAIFRCGALTEAGKLALAPF